MSIIIVAWRDAPMLLACLASVAKNVTGVSYEMLLVLNEPTPELNAEVDRNVTGAEVTKFRTNLGFGGAVNYVAQRAKGSYIALLNDDAAVEAGWLESLVDTAGRRPGCGIVGGTFLNPDGSLQEAGSVLWSDGATAAVGDGAEVGYMAFERQVDYCSGGSIIVRKELWDELGGFDDRYYPAYYEDVDLSLRAQERGWQVWYQPLSQVRHVRSASTGDSRFFLHGLSHQQFRKEWAAKLPGYEEHGDLERAVWRAMGCPVRILVIDDYLADPSMGAGFGRMHDTLLALTAADGLHVAVHPSVARGLTPVSLVQAGVRVVDDLESHLKTPGVDYEVVIFSRPNNFQLFQRLISEELPGARLIYDAEALFFRRVETRIEFASGEAEQDGLCQLAAEMRALEEGIFRAVDAVVCVSASEAEFVRTCTEASVSVVEPRLSTARPTRNSFEHRMHVGLVAGWASGPGSPNCDGLLWFAREVLPKVKAELPGCRILVSGSNPPAEVRWLGGSSVQFVGHVHDLSSFYEQIRVAISPTRFGAGVKIKTVEAIQHGVPVVATGEGIRGLPSSWQRAVCTADSATDFAGAVVALMEDRDAWAKYRQMELEQCGANKVKDQTSSWPAIIRDCLEAVHGAVSRP